MQNQTDNVFNYILGEETSFKTSKVPVGEGWDWSFADHIKRSILMKNSQYEGASLGGRPFKNITRPILNVQYRAENIDVKQVEPYVNDDKNYYKSFLVRKFHPTFARKYNLDTYFDDLVESYVDYGVAISKNVNQVAPEVVPLQRIAFCDQTDILGGPFCEKHAYSVSDLLAMKGKWNSDYIDQAILMAKAEKTNAQAQDQKQKTPGKYIEVYELHGMLPEKYLGKKLESNDYAEQSHYVCFYKDKDNNKQGISLYKGIEKESPYKVLVRDKIYGRCAGFGGIEELFEPQVWINYDAIQIKEMLDVAALMILQTADKTFKTKNKVSDMEKGQIVVHEEGMPVSQVGIQPVNMEMFNRNAQDWTDIARTTGSANESILGESPSAGTPFKLQELVNVEGHGLHDWRRGRIATFIGEVYRDWILKSLVREMNNGKKFIEELSLDEMNEISDTIAINEANRQIIEKIMNNRMVTPEEQQAIIVKEKDKFMKGGSKRFLEILKGELKNLPMEVEINVVGKQKDLDKLTDKLVNIFRDVIANPQALANPAVAKIFNNILESSGLDSLDFATLTKQSPAPAPAGQAPVAADSTLSPIQPNNLSIKQ